MDQQTLFRKPVKPKAPDGDTKRTEFLQNVSDSLTRFFRGDGQCVKEFLMEALVSGTYVPLRGFAHDDVIYMEGVRFKCSELLMLGNVLTTEVPNASAAIHITDARS